MERRKRIFGTDGVRGRANLYPMNVETALLLGKAAGKIFRRHNGKHRVVIGKDTRLSCYMFENALIAGLCSMGVDTLMLGPLPTPGVAFITRAYRADAGIMISASHNPFEDNGIKFFSSEGFKLPNSLEKEIEDLLFENNFEDSFPSDAGIGKNTKITDADGRYIEFVKASFPKKCTLKNTKIVLDCANGAAHRVAPLVFKELDAQLFSYNVSPNGLNINKNCGSLHPEFIQKAVIDHQADIGIALDGDADRVILVDENAQIVDGDTILGICAKDMHKKGLLASNTVVTTVMSNLGLKLAMNELGIDLKETSVGDRYVIEQMKKDNLNLGGEQSGHLIFLEHNTTGDGLVAALQVLRIMNETDSKLSDLASFIKRCPQTLLNVQVKEKPELSSLEKTQKAIKKAESLILNKGRVLVRYSGTENICRVMVEATKQKKAMKIAQGISEIIKEEIGV
jgi:phosphoglucosamine mutase